MSDTMTKAGAERLAHAIAGYWRKRGYTITPRVERVEFDACARSAYYIVRSSMIDGWPSTKSSE